MESAVCVFGDEAMLPKIKKMGSRWKENGIKFWGTDSHSGRQTPSFVNPSSLKLPQKFTKLKSDYLESQKQCRKPIFSRWFLAFAKLQKIAKNSCLQNSDHSVSGYLLSESYLLVQPSDWSMGVPENRVDYYSILYEDVERLARLPHLG